MDGLDDGSDFELDTPESDNEETRYHAPAPGEIGSPRWTNELLLRLDRRTMQMDARQKQQMRILKHQNTEITSLHEVVHGKGNAAGLKDDINNLKTKFGMLAWTVGMIVTGAVVAGFNMLSNWLSSSSP